MTLTCNFQGFSVSRKRHWELVDCCKDLDVLRKELLLEFEKQGRRK